MIAVELRRQARGGDGARRRVGGRDQDRFDGRIGEAGGGERALGLAGLTDARSVLLSCLVPVIEPAAISPAIRTARGRSRSSAVAGRPRGALDDPGESAEGVDRDWNCSLRLLMRAK